MMRFYKQGQKGLTLVETIISVSLFSLLMIVVMSSVATLYRTNSYTMAQSYEIFNARRGVQQFVRDVRETSYADDGTFPLVRKENHLIGFYSDIDRDDSVEYVEYELATTTTFTKRIYNATGTPPQYNTTIPDTTIIISDNVHNLNNATSTFFYYDAAGNLVDTNSSVTDVRYVKMQIIVNIDPNRNPGEFMLEGSAALRNIVNNS